MKPSWILLGLCFLAGGCGGSDGDSGGPSVVPKGTRMMVLDVGPAADGDYDAAFTLAQAAGVEAVTLHLAWNTIETTNGLGCTPGTYDPTLLDISELYYPPKNMGVCITLAGVDTTGTTMPGDLSGLAWDHPDVICRFKKLLDFVLGRIPTLTIPSLSIGNEIDIPFSTDALSYTQYKTFFDAVSAHAKTLRPGIKVGIKATLDGLTDPATSSLMVQVNTNADFVGATYYPLNPAFTPKNPSVVSTDISTLLAVYPVKPVYMLEIGYPSSSLCNPNPPFECFTSSESDQSTFVTEVFKTWDTNSARIPLLNLVRMTDWSQADAEAYGITDFRFIEYLRTLGLRHHTGSGSDKQAWSTFMAEAQVRGW